MAATSIGEVCVQCIIWILCCLCSGLVFIIQQSIYDDISPDPFNFTANAVFTNVTTSASTNVTSACAWTLVVNAASYVINCGPDCVVSNGVCNPSTDGCWGVKWETRMCPRGTPCTNTTFNHCEEGYCRDNACAPAPKIPCIQSERNFHGTLTWTYGGIALTGLVAMAGLVCSPFKDETCRVACLCLPALLPLLLSGSFLGACLNNNQSMYENRGITFSVFTGVGLCSACRLYMFIVEEDERSIYPKRGELSKEWLTSFKLNFANWAMLLFGDQLLTYIASAKATGIAFGADPFESIAANKYCTSWEHDLYVALCIFCGLLCVLLSLRIAWIENNYIRAMHDNGMLGDIISLQVDFHVPACIFIYLPTLTCWFLTMCFLGACRDNRISVLYPYSITLFVSYSVWTILFAYWTCSGRDQVGGKDFEDIVKERNSEQDQAERIEHGKEAFAAAKRHADTDATAAARESVAFHQSLLSSASRMHVTIHKNGEKTEIPISSESTVLDLRAAMAVAHSAEFMHFRMGGISLEGQKTMGEYGVADGAAFTAEANISPDKIEQFKAAEAPAMEAKANASEYTEANVPTEFEQDQALYCKTYQSEYVIAYKRAYLETLCPKMQVAPAEVTLDVSAEDGVAYDGNGMAMRTGSEIVAEGHAVDRQTARNMIDQGVVIDPVKLMKNSTSIKLKMFEEGAESKCVPSKFHRHFQLNPIDGAIIANVIIWIMISSAAYYVSLYYQGNKI